MISRECVKQQMQRLETNYGMEKFKITKPMYELWCEVFAECEEEGFKSSVDEYINTNVFPPNVASIKSIYERQKEYRRHIGALIKAKYRWIANWYEEDFDEETYKAIIEYVFKFPAKSRTKVIDDIGYGAVNYYNSCVENGTPQNFRKTIKEYIEGLKDEY